MWPRLRPQEHRGGSLRPSKLSWLYTATSTCLQLPRHGQASVSPLTSQPEMASTSHAGWQLNQRAENREPDAPDTVNRTCQGGKAPGQLETGSSHGGGAARAASRGAEVNEVAALMEPGM